MSVWLCVSASVTVSGRTECERCEWSVKCTGACIALVLGQPHITCAYGFSTTHGIRCLCVLCLCLCLCVNVFLCMPVCVCVCAGNMRDSAARVSAVNDGIASGTSCAEPPVRVCVCVCRSLCVSECVCMCVTTSSCDGVGVCDHQFV